MLTIIKNSAGEFSSLTKSKVLAFGMPSAPIGGAIFYGKSIDELGILGVPSSVVSSALKNEALSDVSAFADKYRARLDSASAGKLAEYRIKKGIVRDLESASEAELALLTREAEARDTDLVGLLENIGNQATAFRKIALLVGVLETEAGAAIAAISGENPNIESQIQKVLEAAKVQAELAFEEALTLLAV
jgi:hypothetical protein